VFRESQAVRRTGPVTASQLNLSKPAIADAWHSVVPPPCRTFIASGFGAIRVHGLYMRPINWIDQFAMWSPPGLLRLWEPADARIPDLPLLKTSRICIS